MIKIENIFIAIYGLSSVVLFILMVSIGGLFSSFHILSSREISFLISPYSLHEEFTVPLYNLYNTNLLLFCLVLVLRLRNEYGRVAALYLAMSVVFSQLLITYPMDALYLSRSVNGSLHILVALVSGLFIIVALALFSYSFQSKKYFIISKYSLVVSLTVLIAGLLTSLFAFFNKPEYVGILEKLPMAAFLIWIVMMAYGMLWSDKRVHYSLKRKHS